MSMQDSVAIFQATGKEKDAAVKARIALLLKYTDS
jgi:hypothetical protein